MSFTGQTIIDDVHALLADINTYWLDTYLLSWLNSGLKEIVIHKPNAYVVTAPLVLVAGTKQTIPAAGLMLIDIVRNMGTDGLTPGKVVVPLSRAALDGSNPAWHTATPVNVVNHFIFDDRFPKSFYVYPPQPTSGFGSVELIYGATPTPLTTLSDTIVLDGVYENILVDYVAYRALGRESTDPSYVQSSQAHYAAFLAALGAKLQGEAAVQVTMPTGLKAK